KQPIGLRQQPEPNARARATRPSLTRRLELPEPKKERLCLLGYLSGAHTINFIESKNELKDILTLFGSG
ncbi:unnamed protein product, partial [Dovyalis caffra]